MTDRKAIVGKLKVHLVHNESTDDYELHLKSPNQPPMVVPYEKPDNGWGDEPFSFDIELSMEVPRGV